VKPPPTHPYLLSCDFSELEYEIREKTQPNKNQTFMQQNAKLSTTLCALTVFVHAYGVTHNHSKYTLLALFTQKIQWLLVLFKLSNSILCILTFTVTVCDSTKMGD